MLEKWDFKNQQGQFDLLKGILILVVIVDHVLIECTPKTATAVEMKATFLMGCFFFVYGYGAKKTSTARCIRQQAGLLLKPYLIMMAASVAIFTVKTLLKQDSFSVKVIPCILTYLTAPAGIRDMKQFPFAVVGGGPQWFLLNSFWSSLLLNEILKIKEEKIQILLVGASALIGISFGKLPVTFLQIPQTFATLPVLYLGYFWNKHKLFGRKLPVYVYVGSAAVSLVYFYFSKANFCANMWRLWLLDYAGTLLEILTVLSLYMKLRVPGRRVTDQLRMAGRYTYWIMCLNGIDFSSIEIDHMIRRVLKRLYPDSKLLIPCILLQFLWSTGFVTIGCVVLRKIQRQSMKKKLSRLKHGREQ